jgi:hypothetical protein
MNRALAITGCLLDGASQVFELVGLAYHAAPAVLLLVSLVGSHRSQITLSDPILAHCNLKIRETLEVVEIHETQIAGALIQFAATAGLWGCSGLRECGPK